MSLSLFTSFQNVCMYHKIFWFSIKRASIFNKMKVSSCFIGCVTDEQDGDESRNIFSAVVPSAAGTESKSRGFLPFFGKKEERSVGLMGTSYKFDQNKAQKITSVSIT